MDHTADASFRQEERLEVTDKREEKEVSIVEIAPNSSRFGKLSEARGDPLFLDQSFARVIWLNWHKFQSHASGCD